MPRAMSTAPPAMTPVTARLAAAILHDDQLMSCSSAVVHLIRGPDGLPSSHRRDSRPGARQPTG
jgi:hypothetical protein